jgi:Zn-dependent peptidase ImmA (M78 family)
MSELAEKPMQRRQIKLKADELRRESRASKVPINVQAIAEFLGMQVSFQPFKPELSGVLLKEETRTVIGVNSAQASTRQRFTIAHEIGHYVLAHKGEIFVDQTVRRQAVTIRRDNKSSLGTDGNERDANAFAAELLMPEELVYDAVRKHLNKAGDIDPETLVSKLAIEFDVSSEAMQYRLTNLGMFIPQ